MTAYVLPRTAPVPMSYPPADAPPTDLLPIYEFPIVDHAVADDSGYPIWRDGETYFITCPRGFGDRYEWPRRWDLEMRRRSCRS